MENTTIWKFELETQQLHSIEMPEGGQVLTVQVQNEIPCIWVKVNPAKNKEVRIFEVYGTGRVIPSEEIYDRKYIGTYQSGEFVWHLFEMFKPKSKQ